MIRNSSLLSAKTAKSSECEVKNVRVKFDEEKSPTNRNKNQEIYDSQYHDYNYYMQS